jgi:uncharacterized membrane protein
MMGSSTLVLSDAIEALALAIEGLSALVIAAAVARGVVAAAPLVACRRAAGPLVDVRLTLGRWLGLALELTLAADIARTAVAPTWRAIGQLAAIAALRTVLNHVLEREVAEVERRLTAARRDAA